MAEIRADDQITNWLKEQGLIRNEPALPRLPVGLVDLVRDWVSGWDDWYIAGKIKMSKTSAQTSANQQFNKLLHYTQVRGGSLVFHRARYRDLAPPSAQGIRGPLAWQCQLEFRASGPILEDIRNTRKGLYDG